MKLFEAKKWSFAFWACCYELKMYVDVLKLFVVLGMDGSFSMYRSM
jgi:hypothetical protein